MHGVMVQEGNMEGERRQNEEKKRLGGGMQKDGEIKWTTKVEAAMGEGRVWITCVGSM